MNATSLTSSVKFSKFRLWAVILPMVALGFMVARAAWIRETGTTVEIPVRGFDPRDLLSGNYLLFQLDLSGTYDPCATQARDQETAAYYCVSERRLALGQGDCFPRIQAKCRNGRFDSGLERFYIPAENAPLLEKQIREKAGSIKLSVSTDGKAVIKELLIEGRPWKDWVAAQ